MVNDNYTRIACQTILANNFNLKTALINMVHQNQFGSSFVETSNTRLSIILEIYDTIKIIEVSNDVIKLQLFPLSLRDRARSLLHSLQPCNHEALPCGQTWLIHFSPSFFHHLRLSLKQKLAFLSDVTLTLCTKLRRDSRSCFEDVFNIVFKIGQSNQDHY